MKMSKTENNAKQWIIHSWFSCFWDHKASFFIWCLWSRSTDSVILVHFWCLSTTAWSRSTEAVVWIPFSWLARNWQLSIYPRRRIPAFIPHGIKASLCGKKTIKVEFWQGLTSKSVFKKNGTRWNAVTNRSYWLWIGIGPWLLNGRHSILISRPRFLAA